MKTIAIIPARSGSKRIPAKNIKLFCGYPIIEYSIKAALGAGIFDEVMVSTDSEEIAEIAMRCGAKVPFMRSSEMSNDTATTSGVILEVLGKYQDMGVGFDIFCCIYPTAPFVTKNMLIEALDKFIKSGCDALIPVVKFSFPPQRGFLINDNRIAMVQPENLNARSQDLQPIYHDCGQFYFGNVSAFLKAQTLLMPSTMPLVLSELEVQDIDNEEDWEIAEIKYRITRGDGI